jgi:hypothetical protein
MMDINPDAEIYNGMIEMENPGKMRGILQIEDNVPVLYSGDIGYDVTFRVENLLDVIALVGQEVIVTTDRILCAGMVAPNLGHIVVTAIRPA